MTKDLEDRLAALEAELAKARSIDPPEKPRRKLRASQKKVPRVKVVICVVALLLALAGGGYYFLHSKPKIQNPLPTSLITSSSFSLYYPSPLPDGYTYSENSASVESSVLFYKLHDNTKEVLVTQQAKPLSDTGISSAVGFDKVDTPNGVAYIGKNNSSPVAIIQTSKTLINISGTPDVSSDVVNSIAKNLIPLR
jgi:hypothetical protein